jgi:hypothetical protein
MDNWAVAVGATDLVAAAFYGYVGRRLSARTVAPDAQFAATQFTLWWYGLAASGIIIAIVNFASTFGALTFPLGMTAYFLTVVVDCLILWGLVGYLTFVYTGRYHLLELTAFYAAFYTAVLYYVFDSAPSSVGLSAGSIAVHGTVVPPAPLVAFVIFGLIVPEFAGVVAYLSLYRRARDPTRRFRILLVGGGLLLWFLAALFTPGTAAVWGVVRGALEVAGGALSLVAYLPPARLRSRFGVESIDEATTPTRL